LVTEDEGYLLNNQQVEAGQRFDALSSLFNRSTFRHARTLGLATGWRVWEVGAGGPSVPAFFAEQVGGGGLVLATDIDTSWLEGPGQGFRVQRHDVGSEPPPPGHFDLVHARLVLVHVTQRERALATMVAALKPGGWLLLEEADPALQPLVCPDETGPEQVLANKVKRSFRTLMAGRGVDLAYGRTLPRVLRSSGLVEVQADAYFPMGGPACTELERATVEQVRERMVSAGAVTEAEIERHLANVRTGRLDLATSPMVSAWGQKPTGRDTDGGGVPQPAPRG
jgi:SAM-dependent methyltransferase